jgi:YfiH family protein
MNSVNIATIKGNDTTIGIANTTRLGGVSKKPFDSFNLGLHVIDNKIDVEHNRLKFASTLGLSVDNMIYMNQIHGSDVVVVNEMLPDVPTCDAMVTNLPNLALCVLTADCIPIILVDNKNNAIAAVHAGWRGTVQKIVAKTVETMQQQYDSKPDNIYAYMGPGIQPCCYQVGDEVYEAVRQSIPNFETVIQSTSKSYRLDLQAANRQVLMALGVEDQNIHLDKTCVCCQNQTYFSYRADNGQTGRMAMSVWMKA